MKRRGLFPAVLCAVALFDCAADVVDLAGEWRLRPTSGCDVPPCAVTVSGDVHSALFGAGRSKTLAFDGKLDAARLSVVSLNDISCKGGKL